MRDGRTGCASPPGAVAASIAAPSSLRCSPASPPALPADTAAAAGTEQNLCPEPAGPVALGSAQWNGWGRGLDNTRYQPEPAIRASDVPKLAL